MRSAAPRIEHAHGRAVDALVQGRDVGVERRLVDDLADAHDAARDRDAEFREQLRAIAPSATRIAVSRALARSRMSRMSARLVLDPADAIGVTGPRNVDRARRFALARLGRHDLEPLLMIAVLDVQRDRAAERLAAAHARRGSCTSSVSIFMRLPRP